jgi:hypothetical protein
MRKRRLFIEEKRRPRSSLAMARWAPALKWPTVTWGVCVCVFLPVPGWLVALLFPQTRFTRGNQRFTHPHVCLSARGPPALHPIRRQRMIWASPTNGSRYGHRGTPNTGAVGRAALFSCAR